MMKTSSMALANSVSPLFKKKGTKRSRDLTDSFSNSSDIKENSESSSSDSEDNSQL